ncbi:hypothetical protein [Stenotrophomonas sp. CC120222-04]|uniref:hypothetical protein n=1 Tax=Stenotrophomonas sp. CC120222-04 TaxID=1378088 RepID=UPI000B65624F|nr:hypothetical protein [Stenotrophomonas sp. CC120222-04]SNT82803.1 hypothetical protein SAMN02744786_2630 [Stenotrophomonas sp. CC120222-04]
MEIDWNCMGTLKHTGGGYDIRTDPLRILVTTATQGHEGEVSDMLIVMDDGTVIPPDGVLRLARAPGRTPQAFGNLQRPRQLLDHS